MKKLLYLEAKSGLSGDMTVAALLDLGADQAELRRVLASLDLEGYKIEIGRTRKNEIEACYFNVILENYPGHQELDHQHRHHHGHDHNHHHAPDHSEPGHRNINDIFRIIDGSILKPRARELARKIFTIVAEAEAKAHGLPLEQVHFHEVGAVDSIADIVAAAFCLDNLNLTEAVIPSLAEGQGQVQCQHGLLPVPVPAVINILAAYGLAVTITDNQGEMITPTGAAIAAAINNRERLPEKFTILKVGLGAGQKKFKHPNILRAMLIKDETGAATDGVWVLEANIDDCPGEALAFTLEELLRRGARDAFFAPVFMKKNRPAYLLKVICDQDKIKAMEEVIFTHTTTIGLRRSFMERTVLEREIINLGTEHGPTEIKKVTAFGRTRFYPEYESVKKICLASGQPFQEVYDSLRTKAQMESKG